jgi:hypothetical protein
LHVSNELAVNRDHQVSSDADVAMTTEDLQDWCKSPPDIEIRSPSQDPPHFYTPVSVDWAPSPSQDPTYFYTPISVSSSPSPSMNNIGGAPALPGNLLQVSRAPTPAGQQAVTPGGLVPNVFGADNHLTPISIDFCDSDPNNTQTKVIEVEVPSGEALDSEARNLEAPQAELEATPSLRSKRSRQGTGDSAVTVRQGQHSSPASVPISTAKPPRKRQKPNDSALAQVDGDSFIKDADSPTEDQSDPSTQNSADTFSLRDIESTLIAIQIVQENKKIRDFVLDWQRYKTKNHLDSDYQALLECINDPGVLYKLMPESFDHPQQSQSKLSTPAPPTSGSLQMVKSPGYKTVDVSDLATSTFEGPAVQQHAVSPSASINRESQSVFSPASWTPGPMPADHGASESIGTITPSSLALHLKVDCQWPGAGTSCHPSPADTYITTPASSHTPMSACSSTDLGLACALGSAINTNQFGMMPKPTQPEVVCHYSAQLCVSLSEVSG